MDYYRCTSCGARANVVTGCPQCRRQLSDEIASLDRVIMDMQIRSRDMMLQRGTLMARLQGAITHREFLKRISVKRQTRFARTKRLISPINKGPISRTAENSAKASSTTKPATTKTATNTLPRATVPPRQRTGSGLPPAGSGGGLRPPRQRSMPTPPVPGREASTRSLQIIMLGVGGLLIGVGAIVFAVLGPGSFGLAVLATLLLIMTGFALAIPVRLVRQNLSATAQTLATIGLLLVLLNGFIGWRAGIDGRHIPATSYAAGVFACTALLSVAYGVRSHLIAARFGTLLAAQPVLPLLAYHWLPTATGFALVFMVLAAVNLGAGISIGREPTRPALLRELAWSLHGLAFTTAAVFAVSALATTSALRPTLYAAGVLVGTAAVGQTGALLIRRWPLAEIAAGASVLAIVGSVARVGDVAFPGYLLLSATAGIVACALATRLLPRLDRDGPAIAAIAAAGIVTLALIPDAYRAIAATWTAARPMWHADIGAFAANFDATSGVSLPLSLGLLALAMMAAVPGTTRVAVAAGLGGLGVVTLPAAGHWSFDATLAWLTIAAIVGAAGALWSRTTRTAAVLLAAVGLTALVAIAVAAGRLVPAAVVLTVFTAVAVLLSLAAPIAYRWQLPSGPPELRLSAHHALVRELTLGAAALLLPGVSGAWTGVLFEHSTTDPTSAILAASYLGIAVTLAVGAVRQVARAAPSRPLQAGTVASTVIATLLTLANGGSGLDLALSILLLGGALTITLGPAMNASRPSNAWLDGYDIGAAVVTVGVAAALTRFMFLIGTQAEWVSTSALVLSLAAGTRVLAPRLRHGPIAGIAIVGLITGTVLTVDAVGAAARTIEAVKPLWHAPSSAWAAVAADHGQYGWQTPVGLALLACAAAIVLPRPANHDASAVGVVLAAISAPALLGLPEWGPVLIPLVGAGFLLACSLLVRPARGGFGLGIASGVLAIFTSATSLMARDVTTVAMLGFALVGTAAATTAVPIARHRARENEVARTNLVKRLAAARRSAMARTGVGVPAAGVDQVEAEIERLSIVDIAHEPGAHVLPVGGFAVVTAMLAAIAATASAASATGSTRQVLFAAVGATAVLLAIVVLARLPLADLLPWATSGICACAAAITAGGIIVPGTAGAYAGTGALLAVIAEVIRRGTPMSAIAVPGRTTRSTPTGLLSLVTATGLPVGVAVVSLLPALAAALFGPLFWLQHVWEGAPKDSAEGLGALGERYAGSPALIVTAAMLTLAAAVGIIGMIGFNPQMSAAITRRWLVSTVIPCVAMTLLVTPAAARLPWPVGPLAALAVAAMCWLGIALTAPAPASDTAVSWRLARRLVILIGLLAAGAGGAESMATRSTTVQMLAGTVVVATIAGWRGQSRPSRVFGWVGAAGSAEALAVVLGLIAGLSRAYSAFGILAVTGLLLASPLVFRGLRRVERAAELTVVETAANLGAVVAVWLTLPNLRLAAAVLFGWGALLAVPALRPGRTRTDRRIAGYGALACQVAAAWLLLADLSIRTVEAYTVPFAVAALVLGVIEIRAHRDVHSWVALGPALGAGLVPSLVILLAGDAHAERRILLIFASVAVIAVGARFTKVAPVTIGSIVAVVTAIHELTLIAAPNWLVFLAVFLVSGGTLFGLGASYERRQRNVARFRDALRRWN